LERKTRKGRKMMNSIHTVVIYDEKVKKKEFWSYCRHGRISTGYCGWWGRSKNEKSRSRWKG
jgi:hypothetical protein